jgi:hypothetical protein
VFDVRRHLTRVITAVLASALVAGALVGVDPAPAEAKVPKAAARYTAAIEPLAVYVGQTTCSPVAKRGTTAFANLLLRTYPSSRSLGISRSCGVGGKSEHKEGRAFDWGVSVHRAADRKAVDDLMRWLLKTDRFGNRHAMARRLGIQYMIWNGRIWGAYAAGSGWRKYTGANPHTDHVHFSLSWAGARKNTSFWKPRNFSNSSGTAPNQPKAPKPAPDRPAGGTTQPGDRHDWPDPRPDDRVRTNRANPEPKAPKVLERGQRLKVERLVVPAKRRVGKLTRNELRAGRRYLIEVSGTYRYEDRPGSLADAECSTRRGASWWQRERSLRSEQWQADHLDLYVDGNDLYAQADDGQSCDAGNTYRWVYEPRRTGRVPFAVWDPDSYKDNSGHLVVRILDLAEVPDTMTWQVPSRQKAGATSPGLLRGGQEYLVTVSGTWRNGHGGKADAECALGSDGRWRRDVDTYDMVAGEWDYRSLSPRMNGVRTMPVSGGDQCDPNNTYTWVHRPYRTTPLNVRVSDPDGHGDNAGALTVSVKPYDGSATTTPPPTETPLPTPDPAVAPESFSVDSRSATPMTTTQSYPSGTALRVTAKGTYLMRSSKDWIAADAECTATSTDYRWRSARDGLWGTWNGVSSPLGDLAVNGSIITWKPSTGSGSCDSYNHVYTYDLTTPRRGKLSFVVVDDYYADNQGALEVSVEPR